MARGDCRLPFWVRRLGARGVNKVGLGAEHDTLRTEARSCPGGLGIALTEEDLMDHEHIRIVNAAAMRARRGRSLRRGQPRHANAARLHQGKANREIEGSGNMDHDLFLVRGVRRPKSDRQTARTFSDQRNAAAA